MAEKREIYATYAIYASANFYVCRGVIKKVHETLRQPIVGIGFLAARARLFPAKQTKKEPACSVAEQAGVPIDRVMGLMD